VARTLKAAIVPLRGARPLKAAIVPVRGALAPKAVPIACGQGARAMAARKP